MGLRKPFLGISILILLGATFSYNACDNMGNLVNSKSANSQALGPLKLSKNSLSFLFQSNSTDLSTFINSGIPPYTMTVSSGSALTLSGTTFNPNIAGNYKIDISDSKGATSSINISVVDSSVSYDFSKNSLVGKVNGVNNSQLLNYSRDDKNLNVASYYDAGGILRFIAAGMPRFGPAGQGLFVERAAQNQILTSEDFGTNWAAGSVVPTVMAITANASVAPDGTQTADDVDFQAVVGTYLTSNSIVAPAAAVYTGSVWIKTRAATPQTATLKLLGTNAANLGVVLTNNLVRYSITGLAAAGAAVNLTLDNDINGNQLLNATYWGSQLEVGSKPSAFIPTNGTALSRGADIPKITDISQFMNQGTIVLEYVVAQLPVGTNSYLFGMSQGEFTAAPANGIYISGLAQGGATAIEVINQGVSQLSAGGINTAWTMGQTNKVALSYSADGIAAYENGVFVGSIPATTIPTSTEITFGYSGGHGPTSYGNNYIRSFKYYPIQGTQNDLIRLSSP